MGRWDYWRSRIILLISTLSLKILLTISMQSQRLKWIRRKQQPSYISIKRRFVAAPKQKWNACLQTISIECPADFTNDTNIATLSKKNQNEITKI